MKATRHPISGVEQGKAWHDCRVKPQAVTPPRAAASVQGKKLLLGLLGALLVAVGLVFYLGVTGGSTHVPNSKPGVGFTTEPPAAANPSTTSMESGDAAITNDGRRPRASRRASKAHPRRLGSAWRDTEIAAAAKEGRFLPAPTGDGGQGMDPSYIREVVRTEFLSMAQACSTASFSLGRMPAGASK